jgi:aspartate racemase
MPHTGVLAQNVHGAAQCFTRYCEEGARRLGGHTYPDITVDYIGFGHTMAVVRAGDGAAVRGLVARSASHLRGAGADFFVCADNTAHLALDPPGEDMPLPGLHLAQLVAEEAARRGHRRVGVLGTGMLVRSPVYPEWLAHHGIVAERPDDADTDVLDAIILGQVVDGVVATESQERALDVVGRLVERGCDAVALASTELPLLFRGVAVGVPVLDSADIAAEAALDVALGNRPIPTWRGGPHPDLAVPAT